MTAPDYLTVPELAHLLRVKERKVYDLAASGTVPCSRATGKLLFPADAVRAWIEAASSGPGVAPAARPAVLLGSHDPLLDWALRQSRAGLASYLDGSRDGLARFRAREGVAAGLHLLDPETGTWNVWAAQETCGDGNAALIHVARRQRGLILGRDETGVSGVADLAGRRVVPRQAGSGAQILWQVEAERAGLTADDLPATPVARSEADAAEAVADGRADAAFGLAALARRYGLGFVPVIEERFDLLVDRAAWFDPPLQRLMEFCRGAEFRAMASSLSGYDLTYSGQVVWNA